MTKYGFRKCEVCLNWFRGPASKHNQKYLPIHFYNLFEEDLNKEYSENYEDLFSEGEDLDRMYINLEEEVIK